MLLGLYAVATMLVGMLPSMVASHWTWLAGPNPEIPTLDRRYQQPKQRRRRSLFALQPRRQQQQQQQQHQQQHLKSERVLQAPTPSSIIVTAQGGRPPNKNSPPFISLPPYVFPPPTSSPTSYEDHRTPHPEPTMPDTVSTTTPSTAPRTGTATASNMPSASESIVPTGISSTIPSGMASSTPTFGVDLTANSSEQTPLETVVTVADTQSTGTRLTYNSTCRTEGAVNATTTNDFITQTLDFQYRLQVNTAAMNDFDTDVAAIVAALEEGLHVVTVRQQMHCQFDHPATGTSFQVTSIDSTPVDTLDTSTTSGCSSTTNASKNSTSTNATAVTSSSLTCLTVQAGMTVQTFYWRTNRRHMQNGVDSVLIASLGDTWIQAMQNYQTTLLSAASTASSIPSGALVSMEFAGFKASPIVPTDDSGTGTNTTTTTKGDVAGLNDGSSTTNVSKSGMIGGSFVLAIAAACLLFVLTLAIRQKRRASKRAVHTDRILHDQEPLRTAPTQLRGRRRYRRKGSSQRNVATMTARNGLSLEDGLSAVPPGAASDENDDDDDEEDIVDRKVYVVNDHDSLYGDGASGFELSPYHEQERHFADGADDGDDDDDDDVYSTVEPRLPIFIPAPRTRSRQADEESIETPNTVNL